MSIFDQDFLPDDDHLPLQIRAIGNNTMSGLYAIYNPENGKYYEWAYKTPEAAQKAIDSGLQLDHNNSKKKWPIKIHGN